MHLYSHLPQSYSQLAFHSILFIAPLKIFSLFVYFPKTHCTLLLPSLSKFFFTKLTVLFSSPPLSFPHKLPPPFSIFGSSMQFHALSSLAPPSSCTTSHTHPNKDLPMHFHATVMERFLPQKSGRLIKTQIKPQNLMCSHCVVTYCWVTQAPSLFPLAS